jgi:hypothetical protein
MFVLGLFLPYAIHWNDRALGDFAMDTEESWPVVLTIDAVAAAASGVLAGSGAATVRWLRIR